MKYKHFLDSHKIATSLAILVMMALHDQWDNPTAWIYLALHGTYGILWALKSRIFGDKTWEQEATLLLGIGLWASLSFYWVAPWIMTPCCRYLPAHSSSISWRIVRWISSSFSLE